MVKNATQTTRARRRRCFPLPACGAGCVSPQEAFIEKLSFTVLARCAKGKATIAAAIPSAGLVLLYTLRFHRKFPMGPLIRDEISGPNLPRRHFLPFPALVEGRIRGRTPHDSLRVAPLQFTSPPSPRGATAHWHRHKFRNASRQSSDRTPSPLIG